MKENFIKAVDEGKVGRVRIALANELLLDPRGKTFSEMLTYAKDRLPDLFEENKEANYTLIPKEQWNEDFLNKVANDLDLNFSLEKLVFYQAVIEEVEKDKIEALNKRDQKKLIIKEEIDNLEQEAKKEYKPISITITAGGAVLTAIGICLGKTLFTIFGGAALVGGVLLLLNDRKKK